MLIKSLAVAAALIAATPALAAAEDRYALDVSVFRDGVQVIGGHTLIVPEKQAEMSLTDGDLRYELNADLTPVQGDGEDGRLELSVNITHGDDQPQMPRMSLRSGGTARIEVGKRDAVGAWINGYVITLAPVAARPRPDDGEKAAAYLPGGQSATWRPGQPSPEGAGRQGSQRLGKQRMVMRSRSPS